MRKKDTARRSRGQINRRSLLTAATSLPFLAGCSMFEDNEKPILVGHRTDVLSSGVKLAVDREDHNPISLPPAVTVHDWQMVGRQPSHVSDNYVWHGLNERWAKDVGAGISEPDLLAWAALGSFGRGIIQSPPVIKGGRLFFMDAQGFIRAYAWPRMTHIWTFNPGSRSKSSNIGGGLAVDGDTVYAVCGIGQAIAINATTGKPLWRAALSAPGRSAPTLVDGRLFCGALDETFYALDAKNGGQIWTYAASEVETTVFGQPAPAYANGIVIAGFGGGELIAFRAETGEVVWSDMLGDVNSQASTLNLSCVRGLPVIVDSVVYAVSMAQVLVAVDIRTGRRLWESAIASQNSILCVGDWLYVLSLDEQLICIDRLSGHVRWITQLRRFRRVEVSKDIISWIGPVMAGGQLICMSTLVENGFVRVNPVNGALIEVEASKDVSYVPPIVVDEQMLIITNDGKLRSYG
ncbi:MULTISPECIES: PQQ-like beta-propeller repeat protein [Acetobacter]|uniref:PQQ-binding-like beta-propeller repeat protein n=1 Tax=Acetobacter thailandicus TaxID=1502842 RepID=A0ABT3QB14_9PROT|nr:MULTISPECIES: PQQ-like beta-propeller repeat protein [Acetobacter]MBS0959339.1 PQQ-binding-like beta-propeller repeat protein [Acetobacter thailandicus]MBS0980526.1 PQQ-binding-like beta-propeller repeat protein [Acetobacter thailandicus]MBS0984768.1 PQQ-binding-like beta-propeller repeat protein [Acetobacter thailandicus]MBS1003713.1 PQQ-binding-like beta-propeller repeat protein [Acetobacter thailandicus]MCX2562477.1 PQQ-binding-like beta-propeller repeat protein [Acetobacter thailandicus